MAATDTSKSGEDARSALAEQRRALPDLPGVYLFRDGTGRVVYVGKAKSLRPQPDGEVLITDGPYLETKEHIGGFWILETADMDQAVAWARKGVVATRGQVEVREIFFQPAPEEATEG